MKRDSPCTKDRSGLADGMKVRAIEVSFHLHITVHGGLLRMIVEVCISDVLCCPAAACITSRIDVMEILKNSPY
jgi:hypothetical protein